MQLHVPLKKKERKKNRIFRTRRYSFRHRPVVVACRRAGGPHEEPERGGTSLGGTSLRAHREDDRRECEQQQKKTHTNRKGHGRTQPRRYKKEKGEEEAHVATAGLCTRAHGTESPLEPFLLATLQKNVTSRASRPPPPPTDCKGFCPPLLLAHTHTHTQLHPGRAPWPHAGGATLCCALCRQTPKAHRL